MAIKNHGKSSRKDLNIQAKSTRGKGDTTREIGLRGLGKNTIDKFNKFDANHKKAIIHLI